ncbi:hypothetical protein [Kocuria palustris]|uniref:hypothetical protein n=1 Tax=Kocuria palustris TaxID=71999 RepID=UPI003D727C79
MALPPLSRLYAPRTLAFAAASGLGEMIPFHRARGAGRAAIIAAPGIGYAGALVWIMTRRDAGEQALEPSRTAAADQMEEQGADQRWTPQLLGVTAAVGVLMSGLSAAGLALDGAFERFLVRRGVRRPLLVMGATGLVVGWAMEYFDVDSDEADPHPADGSGTDARTTAGPQSADDDAQPSQSGVGKHRDDRPVDAPPRA